VGPHPHALGSSRVARSPGRRRFTFYLLPFTLITPPSYPTARRSNVVDDYHGVRIEDPYRWLEDADDPETVAWVEAQNALTKSHLDGRVRETLAARLRTLYDYPRTGVPFKRGANYFFTYNAGLQDQPVLYVREGRDGHPRGLLDPNVMSRGGPPVSLTAIEVSTGGSLLAYALSKSGSDRQDIFVREVATGIDRPDRLQWVKFASLAWVGDDSGFFYTRFPEPGSVAAGDEHYFNAVFYHRLGDPQDADVLVFDRPDQRETVFDIAVSDDDRWVVVTALQGSSDRSEVYLIDRRDPGLKPFPVFTGFDAAYAFVESGDGRLFFRTDLNAPRGRIISIDPADPAAPAVTIVAETGDKLASASIVHGTLVISYLHDASDKVALFDLSGAPAGRIELPALGSVTAIEGEPQDTEMFLGFTSFVQPSSNYRYDFGAARVEAYGERHLPIDPLDYETTQVWYPSKDGTRVSMFLVHRRGLSRDGNRPVLLTGYGGFNINLTPAFDPANFVLLDAGGVFAVPNLRGGGEYGEAWHEAGMVERKQNVFDDFIAAAEWLIGNGYTRASRLAIEGGSNGGLLVAAAMVQRPELFGAVVCRVPVADMLRYHRFTVGRFWISEYGCADDPAQFPYLLAYSPLHNVRDGVDYPPVLITTADTDDRVSPGMAKKFAARLQAAGHPALALIRVETKAGHGAGKPVSKMIEEDADIFAFVFRHLGIGA
jgi:prolyl oligopeptidase